MRTRKAVLALALGAIFTLTGCITITPPTEPTPAAGQTQEDPLPPAAAPPTQAPAPTESTLQFLQFGSVEEEAFFYLVLPHLDDETERLFGFTLSTSGGLMPEESQEMADSIVTSGYAACNVTQSQSGVAAVSSGFSEEFGEAVWTAAVVSGICL